MAMHVVRYKVEATVAARLCAQLHHVGHGRTQQAAMKNVINKVTVLETHGGPGAISPRIFLMAPHFLRSGPLNI